MVRHARRLRLDINICGELAAEPQASIAFVGLGIGTLSITPTALLLVKEALRSVSLPEAQSAAIRACGEHHQAAGTMVSRASSNVSLTKEKNHDCQHPAQRSSLVQFRAKPVAQNIRFTMFLG